MIPPSPAPLPRRGAQTRIDGEAETDGSSDQKPAVSVILPVYNTGTYLPAAIASLKSQSFSDFEAIVVDDGSTDGSAGIAQQVIGSDHRFRLMAQANLGLSAARNAGLAAATAPLVGFLDSDDRYAPEFLEEMVAALEKTQAPWVTCAVRVVSPEGQSDVSAIHGRRHPAESDVTRFPLDDWCGIVPLWPSAWNKLYRRSLIQNLRFSEGLYYEDHPWFQALADRASSIAYVPRALYLHTQGRSGQITRDGSERVFEQLTVLKKSAGILRGSSKPGGEEALSRLATRLIHERAEVVRDPGRRGRFLNEARAFLAREGLSWSPGWDSSIARGWEDVMAGAVLATVVVPVDRAGPSLARTLASLSRQRLLDFETLIVQSAPDEPGRKALLKAVEKLPGANILAATASDAEGGVSEARNRGLLAARGDYIVFLDAGDTLAPGALWTWVEGMKREGADLGISRFRVEGNATAVHPGSHSGDTPLGARPIPLPESGEDAPDWLALMAGTAGPLPEERVLTLHAHPSAKIFRTDFLRQRALAFPPEPLSSWDLVMRAALEAERTLYIPSASVSISTSAQDRRLWRGVWSAKELHDALMRLAPAFDPLLGRSVWYPRLLSRAIWEKLNFAEFPDDSARDSFLEGARGVVSAAGALADEGQFDPHIGERVRSLFRGDLALP